MASYIALEPDFNEALGGNALTFDTASTPSLFTSTSFLFTLFFVVIVVIASGRYVIAGLHRMEASQVGIKKSNEIFKRVSMGLLGVFSLWLILFTVNRDMLKGDVGLAGLRVDTSVSSGSVGAAGTGASSAPISNTASNTTGLEAIQNDASIRSQLKTNNIHVNKPVCQDPSKTGCTTVGGLTNSTLSMLSQLRSTCSGTIIITGGTETGHKSHGPGLDPVDISIKDGGQLNNCIQSFDKGPTIGFCKTTFINFGYIFCDEKGGDPHWHVYK